MDPITDKSIGLDGAVFSERRSELRRRVIKGATIRFNKGFGALECMVRNESANGAMLIFGDAIGVPPRFAIEIAGQGSRQADVCWRAQGNVGVKLG